MTSTDGAGRLTVLLVVLLSLTVVAVDRTRSAATVPAAQPLPVPAGADGGMYSLAPRGADSAVLSWLESIDGVLALRFSTLEDGRWVAPRTVVRGRQLFSNWADHPGVAASPDGTLIAQWPVVNDGPQPPGSYNNSMRIALSRDGGATWDDAFADGLDNTVSYTGFVSLLPAASGPHAVYLSPPRPISNDPADHRMTFSHVAFDPDGRRIANGVVDADVCSCCPTAIAMTSAGPIAAYRDHEPGEIRDIAVVRFVDGGWMAPRPVHRDGWKINGCPTNGPALAAAGRRVVAAWFTAADDRPRLHAAFSTDGGATFGPPAIVDGTQAVGRPAAVLLDDGSAVVAWLATAGRGTGEGELRLRRVTADGILGPVTVAGAASPGRLSGMPQLIRVGRSLLAAWRGDTLRTVRLPIPTT